jgi:hypothetical protein
MSNTNHAIDVSSLKGVSETLLIPFIMAPITATTHENLF